MKKILRKYGKRTKAEHCFLCGKNRNLEEHHVFGGANRKHSEYYGFVVDLCAVECHRVDPTAVHNDYELMVYLRKIFQIKFEKEQGTREEFRAIFGKSYL